jgi:hypothetical protein
MAGLWEPVRGVQVLTGAAGRRLPDGGRSMESAGRFRLLGWFVEIAPEVFRSAFADQLDPYENGC